MPRIPLNGLCTRCEKQITKSSAARHLLKCFPPQGDSFRIYVGCKDPIFWVYLSVPRKLELYELDRFLRDTWVDCCGHLSSFTIKDRVYQFNESIMEDDLRMDELLSDVLHPGVVARYEYDFGSTTELQLKVLPDPGVDEKNIRLLARNMLPEMICLACDEPAKWVCTQCMYEGPAIYCAKCAKAHDCGEEMMLPVVNSPRMGVCAYTGPDNRIHF